MLHLAHGGGTSAGGHGSTAFVLNVLVGFHLTAFILNVLVGFHLTAFILNELVDKALLLSF